MTSNERDKIIKLRIEGSSYDRISKELNIPKSTISYICKYSIDVENAEHNKEYCLFCGKEMHSIRGKKKKKFCCDKCRYDYWNYQKKENKLKMEEK